MRLFLTNQHRALLLAAGGLLTFGALAFISTPVTVDVACQIKPAQEWLLVRNATGGVMATSTNFAAGVVHEYAVVNVIRGDAFTFDLSTRFAPGDTVRSGDTIVSVHSFELAREIHRLTGDLAVARATLEALQTGEKASVEQEAERGLSLTRERARTLELMAVRQDSLYRRNFISLEQYELARSEAAAAAIEVSIAQARLDIVRTGAKPEQLRLIRSQISELESEIDVLRSQRASMTLTAPFDGILRTEPGSDTLCFVEATPRVAQLHVPVRSVHLVAPGQPVIVHLPSGRSTLAGTLTRLDPRVRLLWGTQVAFATASIDGGSGLIASNTYTTASVELERVSLLVQVQRWLNDLVLELIGAAPGI